MNDFDINQKTYHLYSSIMKGRVVQFTGKFNSDIIKLNQSKLIKLCSNGDDNFTVKAYDHYDHIIMDGIKLRKLIRQLLINKIKYKMSI